MKKNSKKVAIENEVYHLLVYVEDTESKMKKFDTTEEMGKFMDKFLKQYPDYLAPDSDNWIDCAITGITGDVHLFTDSVEVQ